MGKKKYPILDPSRHPVSPRGKTKQNLKSPGEVHSPGTEDHQKTEIRFNDYIQNSSPASTPYHYITKGLFTAIPFTKYIMSTFQQKIIMYFNRQKHSLKRLYKHQNQSQIWKEYWKYQTRNFFKTMINKQRALMEKVDTK